MCGVAGLFEYGGACAASQEIVQQMTAALGHRGPDATGVYVGGPIALGHTRLSILDPSPKGNQPFAICDGEIVITYNGELYNFRELRRELENKGHSFFSHCDTEVIACAYKEWGLQCLDRLSGIFAFAIWDAPRQRLFLARDPMGVKPLFYADDKGCFRFGSEVRAILCDPRVRREFSDEGLDSFFSFSYSAAPLTGLQAVHQLPAAHYALIDKDGLRVSRYWSIPYQERPVDRPFPELVEEYSALFKGVVERQLVSDVPVGMFLSGGLDSSAIAASIAESGHGDFRAFSAGFPETSFNELPYAREAAQATGVTLHEEMLSLDAVELLPKLARFMEEPTADSSMIPIYLLSKMTADHVKVALAGDGADEILAGYDTYRANHWAKVYRRIPKALRKGIIETLVSRIPISDRKYSLHQVATRFIRGAEAGEGRDHCSWRLIVDELLRDRLYTRDFRKRARAFDPLGTYAATLEEAPKQFGSLAGWLHADAVFYLPSDMLVKVDRMSMAHGLEVRVPFLDVEMVAFCANLPAEAKLYRGKVRKHILRESLRGKLPERILNRPKSGFNVPIEKWMREKAMKEMLFDEVRRNRDPIGRYLDVDAIEEVWREHNAREADHGHVLFSILMFSLWCGNMNAV